MTIDIQATSSIYCVKCGCLILDRAVWHNNAGELVFKLKCDSCKLKRIKVGSHGWKDIPFKITELDWQVGDVQACRD